jgi:hypothetical protein
MGCARRLALRASHDPPANIVSWKPARDCDRPVSVQLPVRNCPDRMRASLPRTRVQDVVLGLERLITDPLVVTLDGVAGGRPGQDTIPVSKLRFERVWIDGPKFELLRVPAVNVGATVEVVRRTTLVRYTEARARVTHVRQQYLLEGFVVIAMVVIHTDSLSDLRGL